MRILFIVLIGLLCTQIANADVLVYADKNSKEVLFITEEDSVILSEDDKVKIELTVLPHDIAFYELTEAYEDYKFSNGKFTLNTKKISDKEAEKAQQELDKAKQLEDIISAKEKLEALGLTRAECDALHP